MVEIAKLSLIMLTINFTALAYANDNGLAIAPPMGWRSWNQYGSNITQQLMEHIMDGMVHRGSRLDHATHQPISLCDLGYCDVGIDDAWQAYDSPAAAPAMHYHDMEGYPIVNLTRFPSLKNMTDYAHELNLTAGFYGNNCICRDHCRDDAECEMQIRADVWSFLEWGFDSWKLDGCGGENNLTLFDDYLREMSPDRPIMVENCHWGDEEYDPNPDWCPFNFYRSSGDISLSYPSVLYNLDSVERYRAINASVPGCWAYPDMLQVGIRRHDDGALGLTKAESRTHFGAWAIVSSPLILGHDPFDDEVNDHVWDIISNREAISVNQAYAGDSGGVYEKSSTMTCLNVEDNCYHTLAMASKRRNLDLSLATVPSYQYLSKPLGGGRFAVLLINNAFEATELTARFSDVPGLSCNNNDDVAVRNIWAHLDEGNYQGSWSTIVESHDSAFVILECV